MKKLFYFFILAATFPMFGFAVPSANISQKVLDVFSKTFENAQDVKWVAVQDDYVAAFTQNDIRTIITYNKDGQFLSSRRYYNQEHLPLNILLKIKEKYKDKTIGIVTEVIDEDTLTYSVNVEDEENVYVVESSGRNASIHLSRKFKKQQTDK